MHANNVPNPLPEGAEPISYEEIFGKLGHRSNSVAAAMFTAHKDVSWAEALGVTVAYAADQDGSVAHVKVLLGTHGDSVTPRHFLVQAGDTLKVLYGLRACRPLDETGGRYAGLLGDRRGPAGGASLPPSLVITEAENRQHQHRSFGRAGLAAPAFGTIQSLLSDDEALEKVPVGAGVPAADGGPGGQVAVFQVWKALWVHPKVAALFMGGLSARGAVGLVAELYHSLPMEERDLAEPLIEFVRQAATVNEAGQTPLSVQWVRQDVSLSDALEDWYLSLCSAYAPEVVPPAPVAHQAVGQNSPERGASPNPAVAETGPREPYKRPYNQGELAILYNLCGSHPLRAGDYTPDGLPDFWREFESVRGKFHSARSHVESWFDHHWPADAPKYQRFISTSLLRDLVTLDFDGQDTWLHFSKRCDGLSVFSVYPLADNADPGDRRRKAKAYEDTMDNHRPGEREEMDRLSTGAVSIPHDRTEMWKWVQYFIAAIMTMFGPECPMLGYLQRMKDVLNSDVPFRNHRPEDWRAYFWKYHCAVRAYFSPSSSLDRGQPFNDLHLRMRQGQPVMALEVPPELLGGPQPAASRLGGGKGKGGPAPDPPKGRPAPVATGHDASNTSRRISSEWAQALEKPLQEARDAVRGAGGSWTLKCLYSNGMEEAFGPMVNLLKPERGGRRSPCPRQFTYGECSVKRCNASHSFAREPSREQAKAFLDWVRARCSEIKENPGKA